MSFSPYTDSQDNLSISGNNSQLERSISKTLLNSMCLLVCIFGLAGNGIVAFLLDFRIKRTSFTVYILNLTVADFMFLLFSFILMVHITVYNLQPETLSLYLDLDQVLNVATCIMIACLFGYNTGLFLLTFISLERCLSVFFPIWYQCNRPKHQSVVVCSVLWMLSCLVTSVEFFACGKRKYVFEHQEYLTTYTKSCSILYFSVGFLSFCIFTPIMVLSSLTLFIKVKRDSWKRQPSKLYVVIVITVVLFLIFAMPIRVLLQLEYTLQTYLPMLVVDISALLCTINSSVNPFVYWFVGRQDGGKGSFHVILQRIFRDNINAKEHAQDHRQRASGSNGRETVV